LLLCQGQQAGFILFQIDRGEIAYRREGKVMIRTELVQCRADFLGRGIAIAADPDY